MFAAPSMTADDANRDHTSLTENCVLNTRDRQMEWTYAQPGYPQWNGQVWSTTPPFPTPALTDRSLSSSSLYGERSPSLGSSGAGGFSRRTFDVPCMTSISSPGKNLDDARTMPSISHGDRADVAQSLQNAIPCPSSQHDCSVASLSSTFNGLSMYDQQGADSARPADIESLRMATSFIDARQPTPLLIPMQPTGAGVPLTSVVETLSSKGSKAAAEDPETVAAAFKLSQWGIGIGPGINPKVASSRNGSHCRGRSTASEPPIVNTGNSGPMCVQPGDWICTSCGFVNWRRRDVCMRCFPYADGNEIGRGIQGGELLAKRLAAGLDTDTEEYRRSVQALCPDKTKHSLETGTQRPIVHELPRNPLRAYGNENSFNEGHTVVAPTHDHDVQPSNMLGIHPGPILQQQWRQSSERAMATLPDQLPGYGGYQKPEVYQHPNHYGPTTSQAPQQTQFCGDPSQVLSPYKAYSPQMDWPHRPLPSDGSGVARPFLPRADVSIEESFFPYMAQTSPPEVSQQEDLRQDTTLKGVRSPCRSLATVWSHIDHTPQSSLELPRDIWAPAPKRPMQIRVDPEDVSREKRTKPQPIGTRAAGSCVSGNGASNQASGSSSMTGGKTQERTSEPAERKEDDGSDKNNNSNNNNINVK
ncbi:RNA binding protein [Pseudozyma hubeiensis SY62]|uniref:RNA binding protein n=1 Tax=Pseudozyma hubeiensis (strain SY62) TaxID=1305764 RepID=R9PKF1_PSEHS|nr:RNA binding protein [Pseudozyma hubeiensis SY62]GAC98610.1 RNA binding protein [Pseudozyma hubeiensis SY62]